MPDGELFPLVRPDVPSMRKWKKDIASVYKSNQFSNGGDAWKRLNTKLEQYFPGRKVVAIGNNTIGQISVLDALQIRGKKVIVSNYTFPATLQAVIHSGGIPVIVDVEAHTGEIGIASIERARREFGDISFVLYTRIFGQRNPIQDFEKYLQSKDITLVIDAAAGLPTKPVANSKVIEVFSFHATKAFSVGEGGAIVGPPGKIEQIWKACNFGIQNGNVFSDGLNSKMDEFTSVRALAMLENFSTISERRQEFVNFVYKDLQKKSDIQILGNDGSWAWSLFPIKFSSVSELEKFAEITTTAGLAGKKYYSPSMSQGYAGSAKVLVTEDLTNSEVWANQTYCLPVYAKYKSKELVAIRNIVKRAWPDLK